MSKLLLTNPVVHTGDTYAADGKFALIRNLGAGEMTLGMPYSLASGEKTADMAVAHT